MDPALVGLCIVMSLAGAGLGLFSGLAPGIHVNTLAAMLIAFQVPMTGALSGFIDHDDVPAAICCCIMSASVVHSFVDFVPSVFIGAPDGEDAVSVLPGHRLLLKGRGMEAVRAAAIGSLVGASTAILLAVPLQVVLSGDAGEILDGFTPLVLIVASFVLLASEHARGSGIWGPVAFGLSGMLGLMCMTVPASFDGVLGEGSVMMPLLTGLFGIPILLENAGAARIPKQIDRTRDPVGILPGLKGVAMGAVAGWFSGITSTVGASMSAAILPERSPARFISCVASVGTVTSVLDLVTLSVSGNGRSGTALAIGEIAGDSLSGVMSGTFLLLLFSASVASAAGYWLTIASGRMMSAMVSRVRPAKLGRAVIILLTVLTLALCGPEGLLVLFCATVVGMVPSVCGTGRVILCGCLILPVLMFRLGLA